MPDKHSWLLKVLYPAIWTVVWLLLQVFGPTRVRGRGRVPRHGALLILSNHQADLDPVLVQIATPRLVHFMAKSELFSMPVLGRAIRWFRAFPVHRGAPDRQAIRHAVELLRAGEAVAIFPEGQLSETGDLLPVLPGAALIAKMGEATAICVGIRGTRRAMPYGSVVPRPAFSWIEAIWGEPRRFGKGDDVDAIAAWIQTELSRLTGLPVGDAPKDPAG